MNFKCPSCNSELFSFEMLINIRKDYYSSLNRDYTNTTVIGQYARGVKKFPKEFELICLNEECERFEIPIDKILLEIYNSMKKNIDHPDKSDRNLQRDSKGRFIN